MLGNHLEPPWPVGVASAFSPSAIAAQVAPGRPEDDRGLAGVEEPQ
ncbi:hypothetical protein KL864_32975 [Mycolicibacterium goodii]|nr:hypothetical protein [Mycolicibacterium goodii]